MEMRIRHGCPYMILRFLKKLNNLEILEEIWVILSEKVFPKKIKTNRFIVNQRHFFRETIYEVTHNLVLLMLRVSA